MPVHACEDIAGRVPDVKEKAGGSPCAKEGNGDIFGEGCSFQVEFAKGCGIRRQDLPFMEKNGQVPTA